MTDDTPGEDDLIDIDDTSDDDPSTSEDLLAPWLPVESDSEIRNSEYWWLVTLSKPKNSTFVFNILA